MVPRTNPISHFSVYLVDGSKVGDKTSGGGVLRDTNGDFFYGFCRQYTHKAIIHGELQAIVDGLIYLQDWGRQNVVIETDSSLAWHMIQKTRKEQWTCSFLLRQIWRLMEDTRGIMVIFREQNKVADLLAKHAHSLPSSLAIKKCIYFDRIGFCFPAGL